MSAPNAIPEAYRPFLEALADLLAERVLAEIEGQKHEGRHPGTSRAAAVQATSPAPRQERGRRAR